MKHTLLALLLCSDHAVLRELRREMHGKYNGAITAFKDTAPDRYMPPNAGVDQYKVCWAEGRAGVVTCSGGILALEEVLMQGSDLSGRQHRQHWPLAVPTMLAG